MKTRAIVFNGVDSVTVESTNIPDPVDGEVLIETVYSCISPGTELRCLAGKQTGAPDWPYIPGYALTGRVLATGHGVQQFPVGTPVFSRGTVRCGPQARCWGGHTAHAVVPVERVRIVPEGLDLKEVSLAALASIALRGVRVSLPNFWETVVVFGLGPIGHLSARLHAISGARVIGVDTVPDRANALRAAGLEVVCAPGDTIEATLREVMPDGADIIVDAAGSSLVAKTAVRFARELPWGDTTLTGPRYLIQASYPEEVVLPYNDAFRNELKVLFARDSRPSDLTDVFDLCRRGKLSLSGILGDEK